MELFFIALIEKKKSEGKSICLPFSFPILPLSSRKTVKTSTIPFFIPKKQRLHKLCFLQKTGLSETLLGPCQTPLTWQINKLGPSRVSDSSNSAETVIYEAFVSMEEIWWCFSALLSWRKGIVQRMLEGRRIDLSHIFLFQMQAMQRNPTWFSHHNKGSINYAFCTNWAVRHPAGTRLDSQAL